MSRPDGLVPSSNRGLKGVQKTTAEPATTALCIDYCTFTALLGPIIRASGHEAHLTACLSNEDFQSVIAEQLFMRFFAEIAPGLTLDLERRGYLHGYTTNFRIKAGENNAGFIAFGGERQRGSFCIQLTGAACAHVTAWDTLKERIEADLGRLTRLDVAFDDFLGTHDLTDVLRWHKADKFTVNGRPPAIQECGWDDGSGKTLYVGKNIGNQQLCAYEKGKQLGDKNSPWIRFEARFGAKYRAISLDILTRPADFFVGHYPVFTGIVVAVADRMQTHVKRAISTLVKAMHNARRQYGGLLELLRRNSEDTADFGRFVEILTKRKLPAWANSIPYSYHALPAACRHEFNTRPAYQGVTPC